MLPAQWEGQVSYSETYDSNYDAAYNAPNKNAISAALGWTIQPFAASGTGPSFGTWTKPASVPYLNLFGTVIGGWLMARLAIAAKRSSHPLAAAKLATARFYAEQILAAAPGFLPAIKGGATVTGFDPDQL